MIAVDIGNTCLHFARIREGRVKKIANLATASVTQEAIRNIIKKNSRDVFVVCSVVPGITRFFSGRKNVLIVGKDIKVPIKSFYDKKQVGQDRLVGAYAAKKIFPGARLVLDFGTAITLDIISKKGYYQGGIILPGIGSTLKTFSNCALLPRHIDFSITRKLIPQNTRDSINCGLEEGFAFMINGLVKKYKKKLNIKPKDNIVVTGGEGSFIMPKFNFVYTYEPFLVIKGLWLLSESAG
ncbi:MAG: type III pantothenate kinase [Candidatus Omnitrophica bacterium]|nr:type III pantothenate kinase [Candidatus Omnitrophota bacterium]MDD5429277.1 type III pantothenate kinase [Candidatus Omnitrophota bacterium]